MMDWLQLLSSVTIVFTIAMFMAGIPDCLRIFKTGSTENVPFLPFLATNLNNILWFTYGYLVLDTTLQIVNGVGCCLQTTYMLVFLAYTPAKMKPLQRTVAACVAMVLLYGYLSKFPVTTESVINQLGLVCCTITVLMYISPLTEIASVFRTKSTEGISLPLTVTTLFASSLWVLYGIGVDDMYIQIPNFPGILSSLLRIFLLWLYNGRSKPVQ